MGNLCGPSHEAFNPVLTFNDEMDDDEINEMKNGFKKEPTSKLRLRFNCKDLVFKGDFDPMVVLFRCKDKNFSDPKEEFKTEAVADEKNPQFAKTYLFDYKFEEATYF